MGICKMPHWLMGDGRLCSHAIFPPIFPSNPVPIPRASYNPSHSPPLNHLHLQIPHLSISHSFLSHPLSTLYPSATLSQHPSFLLPPPSAFLSPSSTRPRLSLSLPRSNPILPPFLCFPHV